MELTRAEADTRVARGAAHLDRVRPDWFQAIDTGTLDLSSCRRCIVGQLAGTHAEADFYGAIARLGVDIPQMERLTDAGRPHSNSIAAAHGFDLLYNEVLGGRKRESFARLQDAWIAAIADRKIAHAEIEETLTPVLVRQEQEV